MFFCIIILKISEGFLYGPVFFIVEGITGSGKDLECIRSQTHWKGVYYKALYGLVPEGRKTAWEKQFLADGMIEDMETVVIDGTTIPLHKE